MLSLKKLILFKPFGCYYQTSFVMQPRKTACLYHTDENITNFCRDKNCLMPLCPSCIGDHSQYHQQLGSKPQYFSLYQTLSDVQALLYNSIYSLEQDRKRNHDLIKRIHSLDDLVRERVITAKTMIYNLVDQAFGELQIQLKQSLFKLHQEIGLYSLRKSEKFEESVSEELGELYNINEGLKAQKYLGNIIIYLKDKHQDANTFHTKINTYLQQNEAYEPRLELSNQAKTAICNGIARLIRVQGKKDHEKRREKHMESRPSLFKNKPNKDYIEKSEKIERSYTPQRSAAHLKPATQAQTSRSQLHILTTNSPYRIEPKSKVDVQKDLQRTEPYRERADISFKDFRERDSYRENTFRPPGQASRVGDGNRIRDFKQEFQILSRKVSQMRKENQRNAKQNYK